MGEDRGKQVRTKVVERLLRVKGLFHAGAVIQLAEIEVLVDACLLDLRSKKKRKKP